MKLLIVESPNKVKTIKGYLGDGWEVAASMGHIRDLKKKELSIIKDQNYKMIYEITEDKKQTVKMLQAKVAKVGKENVYLGTDPDREGEAIAYHLCAALGLNYKTTKRVIYHAITEKALLTAVSKAGLLNLKLISAQEARRIFDRLVGYQISPVLGRKMEQGLSAGRVQSVTLRMIIEREDFINNFTPEYKFQITGCFLTTGKDILKARKNGRFETKQQAEQYLNQCHDKIFFVKEVERKPISKLPSPPYMTSSLQKEGVKRLKLSVDQTMKLAQKLFEAGHITYMRTDSQNLSEEAIEQAKQQIILDYGEQLFEQRSFKSKAGSQEAHEAIRPTDFNKKTAGDTLQEKQLYDLIYRRAIASQMKAAIYDQTKITIAEKEYFQQDDQHFVTTAKILSFQGFQLAYLQQEEDNEEEQDEQVIGPVDESEELSIDRMEAKQNFTKPPKRFDQGTIVDELEKKQIGRPSTWGSIIKTLFFREYIHTASVEARQLKSILLTWKENNITQTVKEESFGGDTDKLMGTQKGGKVNDFMMANFLSIVEYDFTKRCEKAFEDITEGKNSFATIVPAFDKKLMEWIKKVEDSFPDAAPTDEVLGQYEGENITAGKSKFGFFIKHGEKFYTSKKKEASLEKAIMIIKEQKAKAAKGLGQYQGRDVYCGKGKYGTYVKYQEKYFSVKDMEPEAVSLQIAINVIDESLKKGQEKEKSVVTEIGKYIIRNGQYGLYVSDGTSNASLPKDTTEQQAMGYTVQQCKDAIKSAKDWKKKNKKKN